MLSLLHCFAYYTHCRISEMSYSKQDKKSIEMELLINSNSNSNSAKNVNSNSDFNTIEQLWLGRNSTYLWVWHLDSWRNGLYRLRTVCFNETSVILVLMCFCLRLTYDDGAVTILDYFLLCYHILVHLNGILSFVLPLAFWEIQGGQVQWYRLKL